MERAGGGRGRSGSGGYIYSGNSKRRRRARRGRKGSRGGGCLLVKWGMRRGNSVKIRRMSRQENKRILKVGGQWRWKRYCFAK